MARIVFIEVTATVSYGGVQTSVWRLAEQLAVIGHDVAIFGGEGSIRPAGLPDNVEVHTFPFVPRNRVPDFGTRFQRIVERISMARHARKAFIAGHYDWAVLTKPFDFIWPWLLPKKNRTRFAFVSGGTDFFAGDRVLSRRIETWMAVSHFNAWQIRSRYRCWPRVIYNGVDTDKFAPGGSTAGLRERLAISTDTVLFVYAGRLVGLKGVGVALRALAEPELRGMAVKLLVVGDGPQRPELKQLAQRLVVADRVIFHDPVAHDALPGIYAAVDAGVFPSISDEAFGIAIAEAMSCAKPVIASHIGGIPEVVGNESTCGLLVPPGDPRALAAAMMTVATGVRLRAQMGQAARTRIVDSFTWSDSAKRLTAALKI